MLSLTNELAELLFQLEEKSGFYQLFCTCTFQIRLSCCQLKHALAKHGNAKSFLTTMRKINYFTETQNLLG